MNKSYHSRQAAQPFSLNLRAPLVRVPQSPHGWQPGAPLPPKGVNPDPYRALERHAEAAERDRLHRLAADRKVA